MADRSISYEFRGKFDNFRAGLSAASRGVRDFGNDLTGLDRKGAQMRRGLDELGGNAGRTSLALGGAFAVVATKAANFEQSMSFVKAATHETAENMDALREAALEAGAQTAFSATEAASAIENLAKAGVSTKDILAGGLTGALDLAAAGGIDVATAAEQAATAMTQFGLAGEDIPHIADLLAAGAGKAQGEVTDLGAALNQSGLVADQVGLSIEETTGALSAFASAGLIGSDAGTSFKTMLGALTPNSKEAAQLMEQLGISAYDAQGNFVGMADFAGVLRNALKDMTDEQRQSTLETIFGSDAVRAASIIYEQGADGIQSWIDKTNDAGYASETAATRMDNLKGDLEQLGGALETAFIGAGDGQTGFLRDLTQSLTSVVNAFNGLPGPVKSATGALLGIGALGAGAFWFTAKAVSTIASTKSALADLGFEAGRTRGALTGIAKAGAGLLTIVTTVNLLQAAMSKVANTKIDTSALGRDLEALADGRVTKNFEDLYHTFEDIDHLGLAKANPIGWISSWDPTGAEDAQENLKAIDASLASLVESGNAETAERAFDQLAEVAAKTGKSTKEAAKLFPEYATALDNAASSGHEAAAATEEVGDAASGAAPQVDEMSEALKKAREDARGAVDSFLNLSAGVKDGKFSFKEWITELERAGNAVANFRVNAAKASRRGLDESLVQQLQSMGTEGALQLEYLAKATDREINRTNHAWRRYGNQSEETLNQIANSVTGITGEMGKLDGVKAKPAAELRDEAFQAKRRAIEKTLRDLSSKKGEPKVDADKKPFDLKLNDVRAGLAKVDGRLVSPRVELSGVGAAEAQLANLTRARLASIRVSVATSKVRDVTNVNAQAEGGTVPGARMPYGDKVLTYLAPGEEVISNRYGQADRHRDLLKAINAGRLADGGTAGPTSEQLRAASRPGPAMGSLAGNAGVVSLSERDIALIAGALAQARPLYGDVHVQDGRDFRRELAADRRRAAIGGVPV